MGLVGYLTFINTTYLDNTFICSIHAGWKGCLNNIIKNTVRKINQMNINNHKLIAIVGPCLEKKNFEIDKDIKDIKNIITNGSTPEAKTTPIRVLKAQDNMTREQKKVLQLRTEKQYSFAAISKELNLSIQEVHQQFMAAYKLLQLKHDQQQSA